MLECPVCKLSVPDATPGCTCGFDFTTRSPHFAMQRLDREVRSGNAEWRRGLVALFFLPVTLSLANPAAWLIGMTQFGLAALWTARGLVRADIANRRLAAAKQLVQLPVARVVVTDRSR